MTKSLESADFVTLTEEIFYGKLHFLCGKFNEAKFANREDLCQKANGYYENLKQKIWTEISLVSVSVQRAKLNFI